MKLNLLKPLKRIFTALTGEETEDKNLVTVVDKIADAVEEGGSGGGVEKFIVHLTSNSSQNGRIGTMDKTTEEITEAYQAGKKITFVYNEENMDVIYVAPHYQYDDFQYLSFFAYDVHPDDNLLHVFLTVGGNAYNRYSFLLYPI